jgi:ABC-type transporter lipoprotein component MlaA
VILRSLVREAGESKISMMEEMKIQEARERREAINREERKVKESIDRYKLMREAMAKMLREERIQNEREKTKETDELLKVYQERE